MDNLSCSFISISFLTNYSCERGELELGCYTEPLIISDLLYISEQGVLSFPGTLLTIGSFLFALISSFTETYNNPTIRVP